MNPLEKESNYQDSIKLFFLTACEEAGIPVSFDRTLANPDTLDTELQRWVSVIHGKMIYGSFTQPALYIACCTRNDAEQYNLVRLSDFVRSLFMDEAQSDGLRRIPVFDFDSNEDERPQVGFVLPRDIVSGDTYDLNDQTKVKQLTIQLWYPTPGSL